MNVIASAVVKKKRYKVQGTGILPKGFGATWFIDLYVRQKLYMLQPNVIDGMQGAAYCFEKN